MASQHLVSRKSAHGPAASARLAPPGTSSAGRVHLCGMDTTAQRQTRPHASAEQQGLGSVVTLSQLAAQLGVSVQTLYDLRSQGPRAARLPGRPGAAVPGQRGASRLVAAGHSYPWKNTTFRPQALREDRILHEIRATGGDVRRLCGLFGLSVEGATRYLATIEHPDLTNEGGSDTQS
jgi:hypothetical protein